MKVKDFWYYLKRASVITLAIFFIGSMLYLFVFGVVLVADSFTLEKVREEEVKCIDEDNNEFIDEWCTEDIYCSRLGIIGDIKCKDVKEGGGESKWKQ